jgi:uncharacterized integral membrane protein
VAEPHDVSPPGRGAPPARTEDERSVPVRLILLGILGLYLLLFAVFNAKTVKVSFVVFTTRVSLIVALVLAAVLGFGAGYIANELRDRRARKALPKA